MGAHEKGMVLESDAAALARQWGWTEPPRAVLDMAAAAIEARDVRSGDLFVALRALTAERRDALMRQKPEKKQTIAWLAESDPGANQCMERVLALKNGYAYYDDLSVLSDDPSMEQDKVLKRAEELDAVVMQMDGGRRVVVFAQSTTLLRFQSMGRAERNSDPIHQACQGDTCVAMGAREQIAMVLSSVRDFGEGTGVEEGAALWAAAAPELADRTEARDFSRIIEHAISAKASDVWLRPFRTGEFMVQLRRFGQLVPSVVPRLPPDVAASLIRLLENKSGANPDSTSIRVPGDGQLTFRSRGSDAFLRLSFIPLNHPGEKRNLKSVSVRVLPRSETSVSAKDLRLPQAVVDELEFVMAENKGIVLFVGPTNSGKSTTMAAALGIHVETFGDTMKRLLVADPIEQFLFGVLAFQGHRGLKEEERFTRLLKAFKRHDPDVIAVGEIRDRMTAELCVDGGASGHMMLSSLHANDSIMAIDLLARSLGSDRRFQFIESLAMIVAQRLVPEVCLAPGCSAVEEPTERERRMVERYCTLRGEALVLPEVVRHRRKNDGCKECGGSGYSGERPINEVLPFGRVAKDATHAMMTGINRRSTLANLRSLTLAQSGMALLKEGVIDVESLIQALPL